MEKMEVEEVVDLSLGARRPSQPTNSTVNNNCGNSWTSRRSLRPRTEPRNYEEGPNLVIVSDDEPKTNGFANGILDSEDDEDIESAVFPPVKELTLDEITERQKLIKKYRDELRNEEMTLVLLKKLRQSQQLKESVSVVTPVTASSNAHISKIPPRIAKPQPNVQHLRGQPALFPRGPPSTHLPPPVQNRTVPQTTSRASGNSRSVGYSERKEARNSPQERREDGQSPAQRQAAAKLALRKQLEKTLLQIPPPKPPPPEMNFIPNPSNTEFIYLVGLEHVVDYITKDCKSPPPPDPFQCGQCSTSFTPVWKWEKSSKSKEPRVICEHCVTSNVKKALKAEHTNRLKTAFVKALQQEQEIEARLAQGSPGPEPAPPKPSTPKPPPVQSPAKQDKTLSQAAALHQQLMRAGLHQPLPAHMLPFSPVLFPYQLALAGKAPSVAAAAAANLVELQRQAADLQRQYMMM